MSPRRIVGLLLVSTLWISPAVADEIRGQGASKASSQEGWPDTAAGKLARGWVAAFSSGETAMRDFLARQMAPKSLEEAGVAKRVERYRDLRQKFGKLALASVVKSTPDKLTVKLMDSDGAQHQFVFTAQNEPPFKLISVGILQHGHFGHGFGGSHP